MVGIRRADGTSGVPTGLASLGMEPCRQRVGPLFLTTSARSKRSKAACTCVCAISGE